MLTFFASPIRATPEQLKKQVELASKSLLTKNALCTAQGLLAVLNSDRQIVALNDTLAKALDYTTVEDVLGLRPGEAVHCIHSGRTPGGCGTSEHCRTCGAAKSIVDSLEKGEPIEDTCVITMRHKDQSISDHAFSVKACPVEVEGERFVLLFMRDITEEERRVALERTFFHDINNIVNGLNMASELLDDNAAPGDNALHKDMRQLISQIRAEINIQRMISLHGRGHKEAARIDAVSVDDILSGLKSAVEYHSSSINRRFNVENRYAEQVLNTDIHILNRVLLNMLINAFEASGPEHEVRLTVDGDAGGVTFSVRNHGHIAKDLSLRIFQYQFSTKGGAGRGLGTYSMKLLGEDVLKGNVGFRSSSDEGTTFFITLPVDKP